MIFRSDFKSLCEYGPSNLIRVPICVCATAGVPEPNKVSAGRVANLDVAARLLPAVDEEPIAHDPQLNPSAIWAVVTPPESERGQCHFSWPVVLE